MRYFNFSKGYIPSLSFSLFLSLFLTINLFAQTTIMEEDFTGQTLPAGWSNIDNGSSGQVWVFNNPSTRTIGGNFDSDFAILDSDNYGSGNSQNATLETAVFDASSYDASLLVEFDYQYRECCSSTMIVEVYNGISWATVETYTGNANYAGTSTASINILTAAAGASNAKVRFTYTGAYAWWFAFDNFKITGVGTVDTDGDGIADIDDLDADNDGIPNAIESACVLGIDSLTFEDHWGAGVDPIGASASPATVFGNTTVTLERRDPLGIVRVEAGGTGINVFNTFNSYKLRQTSTVGGYSEHIFKFSQPVTNLEIGTIDVDYSPNAYTDNVEFKGYYNGLVYTIKPTDVVSGSANIFNSGSNSFTGIANTTTYPDGLAQVTFPVPIDSVVVVYFNTEATVSGNQAISFSASFGFCERPDADGDGIPNFLDLDSDNDGIPDMVEAGAIDVNGDGLIDYPTPNDPTSMVDLDGDGLADTYDDTDTAGGTLGWTNGIEIGSLDSDSDGISNFLDLDADDDGIPDIVEAGGVDNNGDGLVDGLNPNGSLGTDADSDGFADIYDSDDDNTPGVEDTTDPLLMIGGTDTNGDGIANDNAITFINGENINLDTDGDGLMDGIDLDADNDGIPDLVEAGGIDANGDGLVDVTTDADNDGFADIFDTDNDGTIGIDDATLALFKTGGTDTDGDGKADDAAITFVDGANISADTDGDGFPDHLDLDADNDGIPDIVEAGGSTPNNDGMVDVLAAPWDSDNDGLADIYDENNSGTSLVKTTADSNADGKVNAAESMSPGGSNTINIDADAYPNHLDLDADNDGITDVVENAGGVVSADNTSGTLDGIVGDSPTVTDTDNNGWHDPSTTATTDSDGDGIADYLDIDADNDGIVDYLEGVCSTCPTFTLNPILNPTDANGNGVLDIYESLNSSNGTGGSNIGASPNVDDDSANSTPDYLDTDADGDGANDWTEGYDINDNGQAADDLMTMATNYETATSNGYYVNATDTDSDGIPDWLDNQPSVAGYDESTRPPFLNPASAFWFDDDNDGLVDLLDSSQNGTAAPTPDNNGGNDLDWRDMTALVSLPVELSNFFAKEKDCMVELNWTTASEENFNYFEIQWSGDGHEFTRVDWLASQGNANGGSYKMIDDTPSATNYYRLKMVDLDGTFEFSKVVYIKMDCVKTQDDVLVFPNPIEPTQQLNIEFLSNKNAEQIILIDMLGRVVKRITLETTEGKNRLSLDISDLAIGTYQLQIVGSKTSKMILIQE